MLAATICTLKKTEHNPPEDTMKPSNAALTALAISGALIRPEPILVEPIKALSDLGYAANKRKIAISQSTSPSKGKRSRRRRAAKLRALGNIHYDDMGWVNRFSDKGLIESLIRS